MKDEYKHVTAEEFIRVWQTSKSRKEVMQKTGMDSRQVSARLHYYRTVKEVPLKDFRQAKRGPGGIDWEDLRKLAQDLMKEAGDAV